MKRLCVRTFFWNLSRKVRQRGAFKRKERCRNVAWARWLSPSSPQFIHISPRQSSPTLNLSLLMKFIFCQVRRDLKNAYTSNLLSLGAIGNLEGYHSVNKLDLAYWMMSLIWPSYPISQPTNCLTYEWGHQPLADGRCLSEPSWGDQNHPAQNVNSLNLELR